MSSNENVRRQLKAILHSYSSHVYKPDILSEHLDPQYLYLWNLNSLLEVVEFVGPVFEFLAFLNFAKDALFDVGEGEYGDFPDFESELKSLKHIYLINSYILQRRIEEAIRYLFTKVFSMSEVHCSPREIVKSQT